MGDQKFLLSADEIIESGEELWAAVKVVARQVILDAKNEAEDLEQEKLSPLNTKKGSRPRPPFYFKRRPKTTTVADVDADLEEDASEEKEKDDEKSEESSEYEK